ncbi:MAG: fatty acyl-AMP ligase [Acidobacteriota bacterium]|nr:fatty acyl-AMP ligase [Acidobacteriota bacterium]
MDHGTEFRSLIDVLRGHASTRPDDRAYVFLDERGQEAASLTFVELDRAAAALAGELAARARSGDRALLMFPPGLDFIVAFFACQYSGLLAVPTILARHRGLREASVKIIEDCAPHLALTARSSLDHMRAAYAPVPAAAGMEWVGVDHTRLAGGDVSPAGRAWPGPQTISYLQYTSGSTSSPKGVMVSHGNLSANLQMITTADDLGPRSTRVGWIPLFHDMGLIFNALQATWVGALCVLMAPLAFLTRPLSWLRAIHEHRAEMAIAPNFAYELCLEHYDAEKLRGVDLSCWKLALNGSEPVRAGTIERFVETFAAHGLSPSAPHPTYGMAEATLMISGGRHGGRPKLWEVSRRWLQRDRAVASSGGETSQVLVGCGKALNGEQIAIVAPDEKRRLPAGQVGEIWVRGPHVAQGYWGRPETTRETFRAAIAGEEGANWLCTGDLGCLDETGELYVTGRLKDMMIIRGANYYPQDIELTVEKSHPALRPGHSAAFTSLQGEREILVVACEVRSEHLAGLDVDDVAGSVRQRVVREHDLTVHRVLITPPGNILKTTSGKVRRQATRDRWQKGELPTLDANGVLLEASP